MPVKDPFQDMSYDVVDIHHHVGPVHASDNSSPIDITQDQKSRLTVMDRFGIDQACILPPSGWSKRSSPYELNEEMAQYRSSNPERFPYACGAIDVWRPDDCVAELEHIHKALSLDGVVWHHRLQGAFIDSQTTRTALEYCSAEKLPALVHVIADSTLEAPWRLAQLAEEYPGVTFIAMDGFSTPSNSSWMAQIGKRHSNIYFDTGVMTAVGHQLVSFIGEVGADRILLGTDLYVDPVSYHFPFSVYEVLHMPITSEQKAQILNQNARRIFGDRSKAS